MAVNLTPVRSWNDDAVTLVTDALYQRLDAISSAGSNGDMARQNLLNRVEVGVEETC